MLNNNDLDRIFHEKQVKPKNVWIVFLVVILILVFLGALPLFLFAIVNITSDLNLRTSYIYFVIGIAISLIINFISDYVWSRLSKNIEKKKEKKKIDSLKKIANPELTKYVLSNLNSYDGVYCEGYTILASLLENHNSPLLTCRVVYSYKKLVRNRILKFKFIRIRNEEDVDRFEDEKYAHLDHEFIYRSDERSFGDVVINNSNYKVTEVSIGNRPIRIKPIILENTIVYSYPVETSELNTLLDIKFTVEYLVEKDSFTFFHLDFPTKGVDCSFDISALKNNKVELYSYDYINAHEGLSKLHEKGALVHSYVNTKCWSLPKSNLLFIWYEKPNI